jgi:hypothetical protein
MAKKTNLPITLANPYSSQFLFIFIGGLSFIFYKFIINDFCENYTFLFLFIFTNFISSFWVYKLALAIEEIKILYIKPINAFLIYLLIFLKLFFSLLLIHNGPIDESDARLSSFGDSSMLMLSSVLNYIFFPLMYFATNRRFTQKIILYVFIFSSIITLIFASSKSLIIGIIFNLLLFYFLYYKSRGQRLTLTLFSFKSLFFIICIFLIQSLTLIFIYSVGFMDLIVTLANRIAFNFDSAIYGCMINQGNYSPNNFFTYTGLSILKRLDSSFYDLDFYNVPQWLLYEAIGVPRDGRQVFPNDNLFVGLYFGGFGSFAMIYFFLLLITFYRLQNYLVRNSEKSAINFFILVFIFNLPLLYQSSQDFVGLIIILLILFFVNIFLNSFSSLTKY